MVTMQNTDMALIDSVHKPLRLIQIKVNLILLWLDTKHRSLNFLPHLPVWPKVWPKKV
jgi:hypothetical protein